MNILQASKAWGVARSTIYAKINAWELKKTPQGDIDPSEMIRVFGHAKTKKDSLDNTQKYTTLHPQNTLLEQALNFEQEKNKDLQNRLTEVKTRLDRQEQQILELLATIKDLSQGIKRLEAPKSEATPRKKFWGIF